MAEKLYSADQVKHCMSGLTELAKQPRTTFTTFAATAALYDTIVAALEHHTYEEVAKQLHVDGIDITAGTLKQYTRRIQKQRQENIKKTSTKRKSRSKRTSEQADVMTDLSADQSPASRRGKVLPEVNLDHIRVAY
ncbi:MAG: hypothetical protein AAF329_06465 [Cyanobacteria bacterium P01_A01_bin.17]